MNRGLRAGMKPYQWRNFTPRLDVWGVGAGSTTTPSLGGPPNTSPPFQLGRYLYIPEWRLCKYDFWLGFGAGGNGGSGFYLFELPVAMRKSVAFQTAGPPPATGFQYDRVIGNGFVSQGLNQAPQVPMTIVPADFGGRSYGRSVEHWCQGFCHGQRMSGVATIANGNTSIAVTWPGGITLEYTPLASDIIVNATAAATTITGKDVFITAVSTTGFTINVNTSPGTSGLPFAWTLVGTAALLVGSAAPWNMGGDGDYIRGSVTYETAA